MMSRTLTPRQGGTTATSRAPQACSSCRRQKRKCDKVLPCCSLCARMSRPCDYSESLQPTPPPAPNQPLVHEVAALQARLLNLESRLGRQSPGAVVEATPILTGPPSTAVPDGYGPADARPGSLETEPPNCCPPALFLDIDCYKWARMHVPKPSEDVPLEVLELLSNGNGVQEVAAEYFATVHVWFPVISKKRLNLGIWGGGQDLALLFLAMKLIVTPPVDGVSVTQIPLYTACKRTLALLESTGTISLLYLQAMVLVGLYEMGQGIYPAAWMTVGACARYADVIGLPSYRDSTDVLGQCTTWTESEERRRVWWAIYILDRTLSLGSKRRLSVAEPLAVDMLPSDDDAWDEGDMARAHQRPVSLPFSEPRPPFARLCQAAMLITQATTHCQRVRNRYRPGPSAPSPTTAFTTTPSPVSSNNHVSPNTPASFNSNLKDDIPTTTTNNNSSYTTTTTITPAEPPLLDEITTLLDSISSLTTTLATELASLPNLPIHPCLHAAHSLLHSASVLVMDLYACPENLVDGLSTTVPSAAASEAKTADGFALQARAVDGLLVASRGTMRSACALRSAPRGLEPRAVGPLGLDALYSSLTVFQWLVRENGSAEMEEALVEARANLEYLRGRWRLADEYLKLERYHDAAQLMAMR